MNFDPYWVMGVALSMVLVIAIAIVVIFATKVVCSIMRTSDDL